MHPTVIAQLHLTRFSVIVNIMAGLSWIAWKIFADLSLDSLALSYCNLLFNS